MNERAKQLALQALKHPDNDNDGLTVFDNDELDKFAQLIVGECADLANEGFGSANFGLGIKGKNLKEHFGVQE